MFLLGMDEDFGITTPPGPWVFSNSGGSMCTAPDLPLRVDTGATEDIGAIEDGVDECMYVRPRP